MEAKAKIHAVNDRVSGLGDMDEMGARLAELGAERTSAEAGTQPASQAPPQSELSPEAEAAAPSLTTSNPAVITDLTPQPPRSKQSASMAPAAPRQLAPPHHRPPPPEDMDAELWQLLQQSGLQEYGVKLAENGFEDIYTVSLVRCLPLLSRVSCLWLPVCLSRTVCVVSTMYIPYVQAGRLEMRPSLHY